MLSHTKITSLEPIQDMKGMQGLYLSNTKITSLEPIRDMKNLNFLNLTETPVTDLRPLVPLLRNGELRVEGVDDALLDAAHTAPPD